MKTMGNTNASTTQRQPTRYRRHLFSQRRNPAPPLTPATTTSAARLGPKPPVNDSVVEATGWFTFSAGASNQQAQDQAKARAKKVRRCSGACLADVRDGIGRRDRSG